MFRLFNLCFLLILLFPRETFAFSCLLETIPLNSKKTSIDIVHSKEEADLILHEAKSEKKLEHFQIAIEKYNQALSFYKKTNDFKNILEVYSGLIDIYGKTEEKTKCYETAILQHDLALLHNDYLFLVNACLALSITSRYEAEKAMTYLLEAKESADKINDSVLTTKVNLAFAGNYMEMGKYDEAIKIINTGMPVLEKCNDPGLFFSAYNILGIIYRKSGKYQQCAEALEKAASYARESGSTTSESMAENNLIRLYKYNVPDTAKMFLHYRKAKALAKALNNMNMEGRVDAYIAQYYYEQKDYDNCILISNEIMNRAAKFKDYPLTSGMNDLLHHVYKELGDYKQALEYHVQYKADYDSISSIERSVKAKELLTKYETEKKEKELALLNKQKAERELKLISKQNELSQSILLNKQQSQELEISTLTLNQTTIDLEKKKLEIVNAENLIKFKEQEKLIQASVISRQRNQQIIIIGFGLTLLLVGLLLFHRYKLMKKLEAQQALLNERKRISSELHDDLGAQLSTARMLLNNVHKNGSNGNDKELLSSSLSILDSSIKDLRKIMDDLQASTLQDKGLIYATEELVNKINKLQRINFNLSHHGMEQRINYKFEHHLFRITQELVNNTLKYARAQNVMINIVNHGNRIVFMYEDDGVGFDMKNVKRGYGLSNIESRSISMGGEIEFESNPGKGFRSLLELPLMMESKV